MTDEAMFEMLAKYAEGLNTSSIEVLRLFLLVGTLFAYGVGFLSFIAIDRLIDRLSGGLSRLFRWFCSRKSTK